jgi:D-3-phosphoglycerate dehydrogenase
VNLVNAAHLARARGITLVERKTPDAGAFATLVTVSGIAHGVRHAVAGTLANGEQRLVRLDDYELEMAPAPWMLVTRHQDRPGMMGRIGLMLGEADINISAMHLGRSAPRSDAFMLLALDEAVPDGVAEHIRAMDGVLDIWGVELGETP